MVFFSDFSAIFLGSQQLSVPGKALPNNSDTRLGLDDIAFGLCDLGMGTPELGFVSMSELRALRGPLGLPVERDLHFDADKTLSAYAEEARQHGGIVT
jgi:Protein of unknown function (DUF2958)